MPSPMPTLSSLIPLYAVGSGCIIALLFSGGAAAAAATFGVVSAFQPGAFRQSASSFRPGQCYRRAPPPSADAIDRRDFRRACRTERATTSLFYHPSLARYETAESEHDASSYPSVVVDDNVERKQPITLVPVSRHPVMLRTSRPLLSSDECDAVAAYFDRITGDGKITKAGGTAMGDGPSKQAELGARLLDRVRSVIDSLTGCPSHPGESPLPRYVSYHPEDAPPRGTGWGGPTREKLLPDGLHVDTNNSRHFRHMTVLLYLSTNVGIGATTFPLATSLPISPSSGEVAEVGDRIKSDEMEQLVGYAAELIDKDVQHTQAHRHEEGLPFHSMEALENAALDLYKAQISSSGDAASAAASYGAGIRVTPHAGHACVFLNLDEGGYPDPLTFHGGEALLHLKGEGKAKRVLTFFKEVPVEEFGSREEFAERANARREYILKKYF